MLEDKIYPQVCNWTKLSTNWWQTQTSDCCHSSTLSLCLFTYTKTPTLWALGKPQKIWQLCLILHALKMSHAFQCRRQKEQWHQSWRHFSNISGLLKWIFFIILGYFAEDIVHPCWFQCILCPPPCSRMGTQCPGTHIPEFGGWPRVTRPGSWTLPGLWHSKLRAAV